MRLAVSVAKRPKLSKNFKIKTKCTSLGVSPPSVIIYFVANRKIPFITGEYYHIYNRGVDKRDIFNDNKDLSRFLKSVFLFNQNKPIGSIFEYRFGGETPKKDRLVGIVAYCLNPNHFHFILKQLRDNGISEFMKRLGGGYTTYFNLLNKRNGSLFQGVFKSSHIDSNEYLLRVSAYVNLNKDVHDLDKDSLQLTKSSWDEYLKLSNEKICDTDIIIDQFRNRREYEKFAKEALEDIIDNKQKEKELKYLLID